MPSMPPSVLLATLLLGSDGLAVMPVVIVAVVVAYVAAAHIAPHPAPPPAAAAGQPMAGLTRG
jgi:UDP-N-acetylmuramyl pentapeptide phosphotransferase/UDP-N-acetylglucosamine-1-phosphate transferase